VFVLVMVVEEAVLSRDAEGELCDKLFLLNGDQLYSSSLMAAI